MMAIFSPTFISVETWPSMRVMSWWFGVKAILLVDVRGAVDPGDGLARWGGGLYDAGTAFASTGDELLRARPAPTISCASFSATGRGRGSEATHLVRQPPALPDRRHVCLEEVLDDGLLRRLRRLWAAGVLAGEERHGKTVEKSGEATSNPRAESARFADLGASLRPYFYVLPSTVQLVYNDSLYISDI